MSSTFNRMFCCLSIFYIIIFLLILVIHSPTPLFSSCVECAEEMKNVIILISYRMIFPFNYRSLLRIEISLASRRKQVKHLA
jgi:hypothetical protein